MPKSSVTLYTPSSGTVSQYCSSVVIIPASFIRLHARDRFIIQNRNGPILSVVLDASMPPFTGYLSWLADSPHHSHIEKLLYVHPPSDGRVHTLAACLKRDSAIGGTIPMNLSHEYGVPGHWSLKGVAARASSGVAPSRQEDEKKVCRSKVLDRAPASISIASRITTDIFIRMTTTLGSGMRSG